MFNSKLIYSRLHGIALLAISLTACHNNDTSTPSTTSETTHESRTDTASKLMASDTAIVTTPVTDSSSMSKMAAPPTANSTSSAVNAGAMPKPNATKKGMKGKAVITVPSKGTGSMEMDKEGIYNNVEYLPSYPGGTKALQRFFDDNLHYPTAATDDGIEGTVNVDFIVDENGKLTSPHVQGQAPGYGLEAEALRVIQKMPAWTPGKLKGKNVKTRFSLPVKFQLN